MSIQSASLSTIAPLRNTDELDISHDLPPLLPVNVRLLELWTVLHQTPFCEVRLQSSQDIIIPQQWLSHRLNQGRAQMYVQLCNAAAKLQLTKQSQPLSAPDPTTLQKFREALAQPVVASFIAGGVAGAVSRTVVSPLERLKILFQVQSVGREEYKMSVPKALAKMWREEGWRGFMAGNGTNCIRIVPYSAVQFSAYNVYKRVSSSCLQNQTAPFKLPLLGLSVAGSHNERYCPWLCT